MFRILEAKPLPEYRVWVRFSDGIEGEIDLSDMVGKGVFAAWLDPEEFKKVSIDLQTYTLTWPGGIDIAPDALYEELKAQMAA